MNTSMAPPERLRLALGNPARGVLGLVDELLAVSRDQNLRLDWQADHCRVHFRAESIEVPVRKSVVRAALARVAVLCNQRKPDSVSPYGGQGELAVGTNPPTVLQVAFVNTPDQQTLELTPVRVEDAQQDGGLQPPLSASSADQGHLFTRPDASARSTGPDTEATGSGERGKGRGKGTVP